MNCSIELWRKISWVNWYVQEPKTVSWMVWYPPNALGPSGRRIATPCVHYAVVGGLWRLATIPVVTSVLTYGSKRNIIIWFVDILPGWVVVVLEWHIQRTPRRECRRESWRPHDARSPPHTLSHSWNLPLSRQPIPLMTPHISETIPIILAWIIGF